MKRQQLIGPNEGVIGVVGPHHGTEPSKKGGPMGPPFLFTHHR